MARLASIDYEFPEPDYSRMLAERVPASEWPDHQELERLLAISRDLPEGEVVGAILKWQRGDGYAFYRVVNSRPLTLQWLKFGDAWQVETALIRGLTLADVKEIVAADRRRRAVLGGSW